MKHRVTQLVVVALFTAANGAGAQTAEQLESRVDAVKTGQVRLSFAAREGVCGTGANWSRTPGGVVFTNIASRDIESECTRGPVRIVVVRDGGVTTDLRVYVGGRWRANDSVVDLGTVSAQAAGRWLVAMIEKSDPRPVRHAMAAASITDSIDAWPTLFRIARNETLNKDVRNQAISLLSEYAGERASASVDSIAYEPGDRDVRRQAIHAMSQRPGDEAVPNLLRMAETLKDRQLRRVAYYYLGRTRDPRAIEQFEKVLKE